MVSRTPVKRRESGSGKGANQCRWNGVGEVGKRLAGLVLLVFGVSALAGVKGP